MITESGQITGFLIVYVDDLMFLASGEDANNAYAWIRSRWECTPLQGADLESSITFLGVEIQEEINTEGVRGFTLCQRGYIEHVRDPEDQEICADPEGVDEGIT